MAQQAAAERVTSYPPARVGQPQPQPPASAAGLAGNQGFSQQLPGQTATNPANNTIQSPSPIPTTAPGFLPSAIPPPAAIPQPGGQHPAPSINGHNTGQNPGPSVQKSLNGGNRAAFLANLDHLLGVGFGGSIKINHETGAAQATGKVT